MHTFSLSHSLSYKWASAFEEFNYRCLLLLCRSLILWHCDDTKHVQFTIDSTQVKIIYLLLWVHFSYDWKRNLCQYSVNRCQQEKIICTKNKYIWFLITIKMRYLAQTRLQFISKQFSNCDDSHLWILRLIVLST